MLKDMETRIRKASCSIKGMFKKKPVSHELYRRPEKLEGTTHHIKTHCGNPFITVNWDVDKIPREVFMKGSGCVSNIDGLCRMISLALRYGHIEDVIKQLEKVDKCKGCLNDIVLLPKEEKKNYPHSCPDALKRVLKKYIK